jgi:hypothetical protein
MAAIEPAQKRSATVVAHDTVVALKLTNATFMWLGKAYPQIWLPIAREPSRRLYQRNELITPPNEYPKLFTISSTEALGLAREVQAQLERVSLALSGLTECSLRGDIRWRRLKRQ